MHLLGYVISEVDSSMERKNMEMKIAVIADIHGNQFCIGNCLEGYR